MANATTVPIARSSSRKKTSSSLQEGALQEALHALRKSRPGYISAMSKACSQMDALLVDYANLGKVKSVRATLDKAWSNFQENASRYRSLLDEDGIEIHEVDTQYVTQEKRKLQYDLKIEKYTVPPQHILTNKYLKTLPILKWYRQQDLCDLEAVVLLQGLVRQATQGRLRPRLR